MAEGFKKNTIIFIVDTSGSMFGQKIEAVNAAIAECTEVIRNHDNGRYLQMGYATFDEKWGRIVLKDGVGTAAFGVESNSDGFYNLTDFQCLYEGLEKDLRKFDKSDLGLCLLLITDGKPADSGEYTDVLERVKSMDAFRKAERYVVLVGNDVNRLDNNVLEFVGFQADRIVKLNDVASTLSKVSFLSISGENSNAADAARYNSIFGE